MISGIKTLLSSPFTSPTADDITKQWKLLLRKAKDGHTSVDHNKRDAKSTKPSHTPKERSYISHSRVFPDDAILVEAYLKGSYGRENRMTLRLIQCVCKVYDRWYCIFGWQNLKHIQIVDMMCVTCTLIPLESEEFARFPSWNWNGRDTAVEWNCEATATGTIPYYPGRCAYAVPHQRKLQKCGAKLLGMQPPGAGHIGVFTCKHQAYQPEIFKAAKLVAKKAMATMVRFTLAKPLLQYGIWTKTCTKIKSILFHYKL